MNAKRRIYSAEFRQEALRLLESSGKRVIEIEHELGITPGLLYKWQRRYREPASRENGSGTPSIRELEAEIRRLKRDNAILQEEREILKTGKTHRTEHPFSKKKERGWGQHLQPPDVRRYNAGEPVLGRVGT